jgi:hypothetical protein
VLLSRLKSHNNTHMRGLISKLLAVPGILALLAVAACTGSAVVTLTATPSSDNYISYRVGLASIRLQTSGGKAGVVVVPAETTVDFVNLLDFSEVVGAPAVAKGTYTGALITLDYSTAVIIYDDGSLDGVELTPVGTNGKPLQQITVAVTLDPSDPFRSAAKQAGLLALDFNLAASNIVDLSARTVTVTPLMAGSMQPINTKPVRIHGPFMGSNSGFITTGIMPFDGTVAGQGQVSGEPSDTTTYEINGFVSVGTTGQALLATLPASTLMTVFGTLTVSDADTIPPVSPVTTPDTGTVTTPVTTPVAPVTTVGGTTTSTVSFTATQVQVDSTVAGVGLDRLSGVVSARNGNTLGLEDATLTQNDGTATLIPGTTIVNLGPSTVVTYFGQNVAEDFSPQEISVGSVIDAFGVESTTSTGAILVDVSAGRVRLDFSTAEGLVSAQGTSLLTLNLTSLGGRLISAFDFTGSGAAANQYAVATGSLDLSNAVAAAPVVATGFPNAFATASPNYNASTLLDPTTIQAQLVLDWSGGTAAPFTSFDSTAIAIDTNNSSLGPRHQIQTGSQIADIAGLSTGVSITPSTAAAASEFSIGHSTSFTIESFNTYGAFITQLQSELNGTTLATGITAIGQYTLATSVFSATSITLFLNN